MCLEVERKENQVSGVYKSTFCYFRLSCGRLHIRNATRLCLFADSDKRIGSSLDPCLTPRQNVIDELPHKHIKPVRHNIRLYD